MYSLLAKTAVFFQLLLISSITYAQIDREFWFAAPDVYDNGLDFDKPVVVRMTTFSAPAVVTISIPANPGFTPIVINIPANATSTVDLTTWINLLENSAINTPANKGLLITSTAAITAYYEVVSSHCNCNPEIFALKGKNAIGNEFYISAQNTYANDTIRFPAVTNSFDMVATQDNTTINITPSKELIGHPAGVPFTIVLNKGQTYSCAGKYHDKDSQLDGSYVSADKPIAITLKGDLTWGDGACADLIGDQTVPTNVLGIEYIVTKGYLVPADRIFILAVENNTSVFLDGSITPAAVLSQGQTYSFSLNNSSSYIRTDKKVYVYQVTGNGCELGSAIIPKLNCTGSQSVSVVRSSNEQFALMITAQNGTQNNFTVNGNTSIITAASFTPVPGTGGNYVSARVDLSGTIGTGSIVNVANATGKFAMGLMNGSVFVGCRYGYFSDFKSSNVQTTQVEICDKDSTRLSAFGGVTYQWSPATGLSNTTIPDPKASPALTTDYKVIITDASGCIDSAIVKVIVKPRPIHTPTLPVAICTGSNIKIGRSITNVQYTWNTGANTDSIMVNSPGIYWVQTTLNGCSNRDSMTVSLLANPVVNLGTDASLCTVNNIVLDAGNPGASYLWQDGSTTQTYTATGFGKYYVRVTDGSTCASSDTITFSKTPIAPADFFFKQDICNPLSVQFFSVGNNLANPYWNSGDGNIVTGIFNPSHTYPAFGNYTVKFGVETGSCKDTVTKTIDINVTYSDLVITNDTTICMNTSAQLRAQPALSFCWSPTTWLSNPNIPNPVTSTPEKITYYYTAEVPGKNLIVNGDFSNGNMVVGSSYAYTTRNIGEGEYTVGPNPQVWNGLMAGCQDHTGGNGNMLIVNGAAQANVQVWSQSVPIQPNTNYAFSAWLQNVNTHTTGSNPPALQFSINGNNIGNIFQSGFSACAWDQFYIVWNSGNNTNAAISIVNQNTVLAGNDFALDDISFAPVIIQRDSVVISVDTPVVKTINDTTLCLDSNLPLQATGAATWLWSPATGLSNTTISNPVANLHTATDYIVSGTTLNGCIARDTVKVSLFPIPAILTDHDTLICPKTSIQLLANPALVSYTWSPAASLNNPAIANPIATPAYSTVYTVKVTGDHNCSYTDSVNVQLRVIKFTAFSIDRTICKGASVLLKATGGDTYLWSPAGSLDNAAQSSPRATPDTSTLYSVYMAENKCNRDTTIKLFITVNPSPIVTAEKANDLDCITHTTRLNATGSPGNAYLWSPTSGLDQPDMPNPVSSTDTTITYVVAGTKNGCTTLDSVTVYVTSTGKVSFEVPNAFTPNGDGRNDCLGMKSWGGVQLEEFSIFNRWGQRVFTSNKANTCWDGRFKGDPQPAGGYVYVIKAKTYCGPVKRTGMVMLIR